MRQRLQLHTVGDAAAADLWSLSRYETKLVAFSSLGLPNGRATEFAIMLGTIDKAEFDPAKGGIPFTIAMTNIGERCFEPHLSRWLHSQSDPIRNRPN